jgi:hypothetical protein
MKAYFILMFSFLFLQKGICQNTADTLSKSDSIRNLKLEVVHLYGYTGSGYSRVGDNIYLSGENLSPKALWLYNQYYSFVIDDVVKNCQPAKVETGKAWLCFRQEKKAARAQVGSAVTISLIGFGMTIALCATNGDNPAPFLVGGLITTSVATLIPAIHFFKKRNKYYEEGVRNLYSAVDAYNTHCQ